MMKKTIKLAVIHSDDACLWTEASPYTKEFDPESPLKLVNSNIEKTFAFLHEAGRLKADLVCTHEDFTGSGLFILSMDFPQLISSLAEEIPGPLSGRIGEIAKLYHMYVAANYFEKCGSEIYNTSVLIGRTGEIIGKYRKVHLPAGEQWMVTGGTEFPVFETDVGRIGFATCYDIYFPEHCRSVALNGADVIIHQTQGWGMSNKLLGEAVLQTRAIENSVYMLVSKNIQAGDGGKSCILDNYGNLLAASAGDEEALVFAEFEPDYDMTDEAHYNSLFSGVDSIKARQLLERKPSLYSAISTKAPAALEQYKGIELQTTPDKVAGVFKKWMEHCEDLNSGSPAKKEYHW